MSTKSYSPPPFDIPPPELVVSGMWGFQDLMEDLALLDLDSLPAADPLTYATGYLIGKTGGSPEPGPDPDYAAGYACGMRVHRGETPPRWDFAHAAKASGLN